MFCRLRSMLRRMPLTIPAALGFLQWVFTRVTALFTAALWGMRVRNSI